MVYDSIVHKKVKGVSKNIVATISHIEYKDFLLNNKCFRQLMKRIQSKNHRIESTKKIIESTKFIYHALMMKYPKQWI